MFDWQTHIQIHGIKIIKTQTEIEQLALGAFASIDEDGKGGWFPELSYEMGISDTIQWMIGKGEHPFA